MGSMAPTVCCKFSPSGSACLEAAAAAANFSVRSFIFIGAKICSQDARTVLSATNSLWVTLLASCFGCLSSLSMGPYFSDSFLGSIHKATGALAWEATLLTTIPPTHTGSSSLKEVFSTSDLPLPPPARWWYSCSNFLAKRWAGLYLHTSRDREVTPQQVPLYTIFGQVTHRQVFFMPLWAFPFVVSLWASYSPSLGTLYTIAFEIIVNPVFLANNVSSVLKPFLIRHVFPLLGIPCIFFLKKGQKRQHSNLCILLNITHLCKHGFVEIDMSPAIKTTSPLFPSCICAMLPLRPKFSSFHLFFFPFWCLHTISLSKLAYGFKLPNFFSISQAVPLPHPPDLQTFHNQCFSISGEGQFICLLIWCSFWCWSIVW